MKTKVEKMQNARNSNIVAKAITVDTATIIRKAFIGFLTASLFLAMFIFGGNAFADNKDPAEQQKAKEFIENFSDRAIGVLNNTELTDEQQYGEYREILNDAFAIDYIAKLSFGRHHKNAVKKGKQKEVDSFYQLFPEFILKVNSSRLKKLDTKKIEVVKVTPHAKFDIFIRTKAYNSDNKALDVDWRVRIDKNGIVKIVDVKIEGISLVMTQRDDFSSRVNKSGVEGLIIYMQNIIDGLELANKETAS